MPALMAGRTLRRSCVAVRVLVLLGLVLLGPVLLGISARAAEPAPDGDAAPGAVRGVVRPRQQASISSDLSAPVARIGFKEGENFQKGDALIVFDCRTQEAERDAAEADNLEMEFALKNAEYLSAHKAGGALDAGIARARAAKTAARVTAMKVRLAQCSIGAPFDGRIAELGIREHETPVAGRPILTVIETQQPEIELVVPSSWLRWLSQGRTFTFQIDETATSGPAAVTRIAATVDPVSQTIKVFGEFSRPSDSILAGMSGTANFDGGGN